MGPHAEARPPHLQGEGLFDAPRISANIDAAADSRVCRISSVGGDEMPTAERLSRLCTSLRVVARRSASGRESDWFEGVSSCSCICFAIELGDPADGSEIMRGGFAVPRAESSGICTLVEAVPVATMDDMEHD
jgi:hypothetical protein